MTSWTYIEDFDEFLNGIELSMVRKEGKRFYRVAVMIGSGRIWDDELKRLSATEVSLYDDESNDAYMEVSTLPEMESYLEKFGFGGRHV